MKQFQTIMLTCAMSIVEGLSPASEIGDALAEWKTDDGLPGLVSLVWDGTGPKG